VPGPHVHYRLTAQWATEEGMPEADAQVVAQADLEVDMHWPGSQKWGRHFNPTASLWFSPRYRFAAVRLARAGAHSEALVSLGRALHSRQDAIGHGLLGLAHLKHRFGLLQRDPDDWNLMPPAVRAAIERDTRAMVRRYLAVTR
jgi:hypothetical protein